MPSVGTPSVSTSRSMRGALSAYTDAGPPERINACGFRARTSCAVIVCGTSSEYTLASRTRRAISWAYCPPRSTTRTGRSSGARSGSRTTAASPPVIRRLLRDRHIVRVRLAVACRRDSHESSALQLADRAGAAVPHRLPKAADELVEDGSEWPLVQNATLDSFGNELLDVLDVALEIPVLRKPARAHRADRAHTSVLLEALTLRQDDIAGALVRAGEHRARHDGVGAGGNRLGDVSRGREAPVGDEADVVPRGELRAVVDRRHLRDADAGDDPGGADRSRAHTDL